MSILMFIVSPPLTIILDTCSFRNLFNTRLEDGESLLLKLLDFCKLCIPATVKEELLDDITKGEFASSDEEKEEVRTVLKSARILRFYEIEKECYNVLKRTEISVQKIRTKADRECLILALQLSRYNEYKLENIFLVTDDVKLYDISRNVFDSQFIGKTCSSCYLLVFLSVRRFLKVAKSDLLNMLTSFLNIYHEETKITEIKNLMDIVKKVACPYGCKYYPKCIIFNFNV